MNTFYILGIKLASGDRDKFFVLKWFITLEERKTEVIIIKYKKTKTSFVKFWLCIKCCARHITYILLFNLYSLTGIVLILQIKESLFLTWRVQAMCTIEKWKWKSLSFVWLRPMGCTVHGILQARILEWVAFPFSRGSSQPRDGTQVSCIAGRFFTSWATGKPKNTGVGSLSLLQQIFPTQELNQGLLHCRWILYQLS